MQNPKSVLFNVNRLLENSRRSDLRGYNIYTNGKSEAKRPRGDELLSPKWDAPALGLGGMIAIGHELSVKDVLVPVFSVGGRTLAFRPARNRWTPAYMDTLYRAEPFSAYRSTGLIAVRERKCFTADDTFLSHLTVTNDGQEPIVLQISLSLPFERGVEGGYRVTAEITPQSIGKKLTLCGFAEAKTDLDTDTVTLPPQGRLTLKYGFAFSRTSHATAQAALEKAFSARDPFGDSEERFNQWMADNAPLFTTENTDLLKVYYYRFFLIKCAIHTPSLVLADEEYDGIGVYESPFGAWFGAPVGLPVPLQIEEMKWMKDDKPLSAHIENWCRGVGCMQDYIQYTPMVLFRLYLQTGDRDLLEKCYPACMRYTLQKVNENEPSLPVTRGSWVVGAEYQPAFYQFTEPKWDWRHDSQGHRLEGFPISELYRVDACVMHAANLLACESMARHLNKEEDAARFARHAAYAVEQIRVLFWDEEKQFFFDADAKTKQKCDQAYGYDGFMPLLLPAFGKAYHGVFRELCEGGRFDGDFGFTSVGKDCPMYWFDNCIVGPTAASPENPHPYGCSWNGPIWPFATSLILDALGRASYENEALFPLFRRAFLSYTELHFVGGERTLPCIGEHYRPTDGVSFSPYTEYFHSEWLNLFFSYYIGLRISDTGVCCSPMTDEEFSLTDVTILGKRYSVTQRKENGKTVCTLIEK